MEAVVAVFALLFLLFVVLGAYATVDARLAYRFTDATSIAFTARQLNAATQRETGGPNVQRSFLLSLTAGF